MTRRAACGGMGMPDSLIDRVSTELSAHAYRFNRETDLHQGLASVLEGAGIQHRREVIAGPRDRFDILVEPGLVIEAKVKGSLAEALIQCKRYAELPDVSAVLLVTTRHWGNTPDRELTFSGKPVRILKLKGVAF